MNKKIRTEIAVGIILLVSIIIGGLFWLGDKNIKSDDQTEAMQSIDQDNQMQNKSFGNDDADISDDIKEKCQKNGCIGECFDGWEYGCFYDGNKNKESDFELDFEVKPKNLCFGTRFRSVCGRCMNKFELKQGEEFIEVSCEEFYREIENKNKECDNCLKEIMSAS